ncbi:hypothetical protein CFC21_033649 [Triticum aestivum]|uniref:Uncharacterized protein n=2 Tax=Triticum aestivum TaxID=4565 RepID=A0A9R1F2C4_WHEAT|nr:uncharacterized protein LOC119271034 [Triticum dicoccoides]XP_044336508.1 uncharacterized protein LOC123057650 [Triticum aestivum]KAF7020566.1 hypothetical protein CFC21_033649 [Triticum aestivum]
MESSSSSLLLSSYAGSNKRARGADLEVVSSAEAEAAKRMRPEDLLDLLDDDTNAAAAGDLASVMRSLEEEICADDLTPPQPELGFLLEASDDELGLPPAAAASSSSDDAEGWEPEVTAGVFGEQIWSFEDEIEGAYAFGGVAYSPEAAAATAAADAEWGDDGFDAGLFGFGDESLGPSDVDVLRQETMPAV